MAKLTLKLNGKVLKELELEPGTEYFAGRESDCAFHLEDFRGISRQHLKIYETGGVWCCESLSRFLHPSLGADNFEHLEMNESVTFTLTPYEFEFETQAPAQVEESPSSAKAEAEPRSPSAGALVPAHAAAGGAHDFEEDTNSSYGGDATVVGTIQLNTTLRICYPSSSDNETLKLEGQVWTAGRESDCEIQLHNPKISRRHFELVKNPDGYYVTDLGSSNGTYLNGRRIPPHEPTRVVSGDTLKALDIEMHFEVKAANLPAVTAQPLPLASPWMNLPVPMPQNNYPMVGPYEYDATQIGTLPGLDDGPKDWKQKLKSFDWKKNKVRVALIALVPVLLVGLLMDNGTPEKTPAKNADKKEANASFENLSPEQKTAIKDSLNLARNLYVQGKYSLCLAELAKLHETVPFYDNSKELESFCIQGHELTQRKLDQERKEKEKAMTEQKITDITATCAEKFKDSSNPEEVRRCLTEAIELNPEHPKILELVQRAEDRQREKKLLAAEKMEEQKEKQLALGIFHRAQRYREQGDLNKAKSYYQRFISQADRELSNEKHIAQRELASVSKTLQQKIDLALDKCKALGDSEKYKEAYTACSDALKEHAGLQEAMNLRDKYMHKLRLQMKVLYEDAKLEESLGNLEAAKDKWKKIRDQDIDVGDFYKKSTIKLRQYGAL